MLELGFVNKGDPQNFTFSNKFKAEHEGTTYPQFLHRKSQVEKLKKVTDSLVHEKD